MVVLTGGVQHAAGYGVRLDQRRSADRISGGAAASSSRSASIAAAASVAVEMSRRSRAWRRSDRRAPARRRRRRRGWSASDHGNGSWWSATASAITSGMRQSRRCSAPSSAWSIAEAGLLRRQLRGVVQTGQQDRPYAVGCAAQEQLADVVGGRPAANASPASAPTSGASSRRRSEPPGTHGARIAVDEIVPSAPRADGRCRQPEPRRPAPATLVRGSSPSMASCRPSACHRTES